MEYKVNDILVWTWGYDCTYVHFFKVVRTTNASVEIVEVETIDEGEYRGTSIPSETIKKDSRYNGTYRVKKNGFINMDKASDSSFGFPQSICKKWDGRPQRWDSGYQFNA